MSTPRAKSYSWILPVLLLVIPVLYVLSMGPTYWLAMRISSQPGPDVNWPKVVWHNAYMPIVFVARRDPEVRRMVSKYLSFWDPRPARTPELQKKRADAGAPARSSAILKSDAANSH